MKKMPRKFSQGGEMQPKEQAKSAEPKKPADNMPDWAKKAREEQKADMATDKGYKAATAKDRLAPKGFKKGGSIKKFAEGDSVTLPSNETYRFNPDTYEKARRYIETGKKDDEQEKPKAKSSAAPKATPKKSEATTAPKSAAPKSEETTSPTSRSVNQRIKDALTPKESPKVKDNESDSDLSVEPRRYLSRGRNYSATGEMSPEAEKAVDRASLLAGVAGLGRAALTRGARGLNTLMRSEGNLLTGPEARKQLTGPEARSLISRSETPRLPSPAASSKKSIFKRDAEDAVVKSERSRTARDLDEMRFADEGNPNFKRGGKVAKYAKGGGVESKGKTKGTVVKMAKGGSVKGWGISRGAKACKMV